MVRDDNQREEQRTPPTYTPWLLVRSTPSDQGARPLPAGTVFWGCPDLALAPADTLGRVQAGNQVTVTVTVQNVGLAPAYGVRARFWWADPSTGVSPATGTLIGDSEPVSIPGGLSEALPCAAAWTPQFVNGGHECLVVEVSCLGDPANYPFRPDLDRHVGQRNVTVLGPADALPIMLTLANPFSVDALTTLHVRTDLLFGAGRLADLQLHVPFADALIHASDPTLAERLAERGLEHGRTRPGAGMHIGTAAVTRGDAGGFDEETQRALRNLRDNGPDMGPAVTEVVLPPSGVGQVEVTVQPGGDGGVLVHHLTQVTEGVEVGGYTVVSPPD